MIRICRITFESRLDYAEGHADKATSESIRRHIAAGCKACSADLQWITQFTPFLAASLSCATEDVSDWARARAHRIMPAADRKSAGGRLREGIALVAQILFDSRNGALQTARDGGDGSIHLVYRAENADIDVWQEADRSGDWFVTGQALALGSEELPAPRSVLLSGPESSYREGTIEDGEFEFEAVPPGTYSLQMGWDTFEIRVDDLRVGDSESV